MKLININMRCIEMYQIESDNLKKLQININMRCIEINITTGFSNRGDRLTLT